VRGRSAQARAGYLAAIAATVRGYHDRTEQQVAAVRRVQRLAAVRAELLKDIERTAGYPAGYGSPGSADGVAESRLDE
jgi:hypothetical protein